VLEGGKKDEMTMPKAKQVNEQKIENTEAE
jgi:hypothetical protein